MRINTPLCFSFILGLFGALYGGCADSSSGGQTPGALGTEGCTATPDCNSCGTCLDACQCGGGEIELCLSACGGGNGGSGNAGGNGGSGATSGSGGSGAAGGSGATSGSGGSGAAGGSGASGGNGGSGGGTCDAGVEFTDVTCGTCASNSCCPQLTACFGTSTTTTPPDCAFLFDCIQTECANITDETAFNECVQSTCGSYLTQEAVDAYNGLACIGDYCSTECGG